MNKEEIMDTLEQIILELPQYRHITNKLYNRYISNYVRYEIEQEQIYTEGNKNSSRNYCWDIYDTIPIDIVESILDYFKEQENTKEENINLKQALNEIRECCENNAIEVNTKEYGNLVVTNIDDILQIIEEAIGDDTNG